MKIATRILVRGPALVLGTACLVGLVAFWGGRSLVADLQRRALDAQSEAEAERLRFALAEIQNDVLLLAQLPAVRAVAMASAGIGTREDAANWGDRVAGMFLSMLASKTDYAQIRLLGIANEGRELIRADRRRGEVVRIPEAELQAKGQRDYFEATLALGPGRIFVSDISLNRERGALESPHRPMVRAAMTLADDSGEALGIVIINMNFADFAARVFPKGENDYDYYIANDSGDYVLHPDPRREFGFDLGQRYRLQDEFPGLTSIFAPDTGSATATLTDEQRRGGGLVEARRVHAFIHEPDRFLLLALATSFQASNASVAIIASQVVGLTLLLLVGASALAVLSARYIIRPLSELTAAAQTMEDEGRPDFRLGARRDEIGTLSRALEHMVERLDDKNQQLETTNVDLDYFARIVSHDLREPARRMALLANLLQTDEHAQLSQEGRGTVQRIRDEGLRMVEHLTDLRAFSRLGQTAMRREPTDLAALIESVLERHRETLMARRIKTIIEPMPEMPVYRSLVDLLYGNLIENALQHVAADGFVLMFTCKPRGDGFVLGVSNTGSTIATDPDEIFEPFHGAGRAEGSGLGLSICRRIVERHAGKIWVEYDPHHVHFMFTLSGTPLD